MWELQKVRNYSLTDAASHLSTGLLALLGPSLAPLEDVGDAFTEEEGHGGRGLESIYSQSKNKKLRASEGSWHLEESQIFLHLWGVLFLPRDVLLEWLAFVK